MPPMSAMTTDSPRTMRRIWRRVMPTARSSPSSRVRSYTDSASVLMMPSMAMISASSSNAAVTARNWSIAPSCSSLVLLTREHVDVGEVVAERAVDRRPRRATSPLRADT